MKIIKVVALILLLSGTAAAQDRILEDKAVKSPTEKSGMELLACYTATAMLYGGHPSFRDDGLLPKPGAQFGPPKLS